MFQGLQQSSEVDAIMMFTYYGGETSGLEMFHYWPLCSSSSDNMTFES